MERVFCGHEKGHPENKGWPKFGGKGLYPRANGVCDFTRDPTRSVPLKASMPQQRYKKRPRFSAQPSESQSENNLFLPEFPVKANVPPYQHYPNPPIMYLDTKIVSANANVGNKNAVVFTNRCAF